MNYTKSDIPDIVDNFNKNIKRIVKVLDATINNSSYNIFRRRLFIVIKDSPLILLQNGGEYIYSKKDYIINNDLDKLFEKKISEYVKPDEIEASNIEYKEIETLFDSICEIWKKFNTNEKDYINKIFKNLLSEYSKYMSI